MTETKQGGGCLKVFFIVLGLFMLVSAVGGYYIYNNLGNIGRDVSAKFVLKMGEGLISGTTVSEEEKVEILKPFAEFAKDIQAGEVSIEDATEVFEHITQGSSFVIISIQSIIDSHVKESELSIDERRNIELQLRRLGEGVRTGRIPVAAAQEIFNEVIPNLSGIESNIPTDSLDNSALLELAERAKATADQAGMEKRNFEFDLVKEISLGFKNALIKSRKADH